jgi:isopenicillin N synthase-like dioxygenase
MMTADFEVPTIDISPYLVSGATAANSEACAAVARELDRACREVGFVQVVGHGVPQDSIDGLIEALDEFFFLPLDTKKEYRRERGALRGYSPPKSESLSMSMGVVPANMMNDFYEAFTVGTQSDWYPGVELPTAGYAHNTWPDAAPGFQPKVEAYFEDVTYLSRVLLTAFTDALGLEPGYFDGLTDHSIDSMKMNNYTLPEGEIEISGELTGMGAHTDFGILTVLWADQVDGLEVVGSDNAWHPVMPSDGALLINLGDAMARWTNDAWKSTLHRVNPPVIDGKINRRRSAAFFFDGNYDAVIEPLPGMVRDGDESYPPVTVAEHLSAKAAGVQSGKAPTNAHREAARLQASGSVG